MGMALAIPMFFRKVTSSTRGTLQSFTLPVNSGYHTCHPNLIKSLRLCFNVFKWPNPVFWDRTLTMTQTLSRRKMEVTRFCRLSHLWLPSWTICFRLQAESVRFSLARRRYCLLINSSWVRLS